MIVLAFANGDRRALKDLLSSEVYDSFDGVIKDREHAAENRNAVRFDSTRPNSSARKPAIARRS